MAEKNQPDSLLKLEPNLVLLFSVIAIPVFIAGALLILATVRAEMNQLVGDALLGGTAADTARHLDSYLLNTLTTVSIVASTPTFHDAVQASNLAYRGQPEDIEARLKATDREWVQSRGAIPLALDVVGAPASDHLRRVAELHQSYEEMLLTDRFGALVAATNITTDYSQADESWWREAYGDGETGSLHFGDVHFDRSAGAYTLEIALPLTEKHDDGTTEVSGVLKALIGARELFAVIGSVERGSSGHALLINGDDGTIVAGRDASDVMQRQYPALAQLKENILEGNRSFIGRQGDELWLASFAGMPQPSPAPFGNWVVVVQQLYSEIGAPVRRATTSLIVFFTRALLVLTLVMMSVP